MAIKLSVVGNVVYGAVLGTLQWPLQAAVTGSTGNLPPIRPVVLVMDPWDLLAVPVLVVPLLLLRRLLESRTQGLTRPLHPSTHFDV